MNIIIKNLIVILLFIFLDYLWISFNIDMYNKNTIKITSGEYDYMNAIEHVNSIFNLYHIIKFKYKKNDNFLEEYIPNKINSFDLNLFYNLHIIKK